MGTDKMKISKGIVSAVRALGGRFLELDECTEIYSDIGDKRATEKTSQALREGLSKLRRASSHETELSHYQISSEGYFAFSVHVLESLYSLKEITENASSAAASCLPDAVPSAIIFGHSDMKVTAPGMLQQVQGPLDNQKGQAPTPRDTKQSPSSNTLEPVHSSLASIRDFISMTNVRSTLDSVESAAGNKHSAAGDDIVGQEVHDLMRWSEVQLVQVGNSAVDNTFGYLDLGNSDDDKELMDRSVMTIAPDDMSSWSDDSKFCEKRSLRFQNNNH